MSDEKAPRAVKTEEVMAYAKKKCRTCYGTGRFISVGKPVVSVVDNPPEVERVEKVCGCAAFRFMSRNQHALMRNPKTGAMFWKA